MSEGRGKGVGECGRAGIGNSQRFIRDRSGMDGAGNGGRVEGDGGRGFYTITADGKLKITFIGVVAGQCHRGRAQP